MSSVRARWRHPIRSEEDVVRVRTAVRDLARVVGFESFGLAALTTATSELTRNTWVHGGGGFAEVEELEEGPRRGIRILFHDEGPGIADLERALRGGFSTRRSLGLGLSGSRRLVDEFAVESAPGVGTEVRVVKWTRR